MLVYLLKYRQLIAMTLVSHLHT